ncbi:uncharacterized protein K460DRAFT_135123 [Cucurbitaria berberidis CBS 394.84]|uniref:Secreted protein n=1 Tax=Cucurbitaria berberidis CBS 394.84 TaxID=1168544 RepID=A0A9P4GBL3_9PLEO|nr:uncharacterized protein K460DRAFT_135123 [Cucurbitaria berberidis CBS 394.84]KAF1842848.1 hypothetical protein K460DRAFT_135123 [Cucurbitaria berberidis CBS 394.84]
MRLFGVFLSIAALSNGILAQENFVARLPNCAVRLLPTHPSPKRLELTLQSRQNVLLLPCPHRHVSPQTWPVSVPMPNSWQRPEPAMRPTVLSLRCYDRQTRRMLPAVFRFATRERP